MGPDACDAIASWQETYGTDVSSCSAAVNEREQVLAYVLDRALDDARVELTAVKASQYGMGKYEEGFADAEKIHQEEQAAWVSGRKEHREEMEELEERLEAEVARNHRLQEALVVALKG